MIGHGVQLNYFNKADLVLSTLSGVLGVFAEAHVAGLFDKRWEQPLLDWGGFTATLPLGNVSGKHCLVGTCPSTILLPGFGL